MFYETGHWDLYYAYGEHANSVVNGLEMKTEIDGIYHLAI